MCACRKRLNSNGVDAVNQVCTKPRQQSIHLTTRRRRRLLKGDDAKRRRRTRCVPVSNVRLNNRTSNQRTIRVRVTGVRVRARPLPQLLSYSACHSLPATWRRRRRQHACTAYTTPNSEVVVSAFTLKYALLGGSSTLSLLPSQLPSAAHPPPPPPPPPYPPGRRRSDDCTASKTKARSSTSTAVLHLHRPEEKISTPQRHH